MKIPPYKIKMVAPVKLIPRDERLKKIKQAGYNLFFLNSEDVYIDMLTDSGTGAMSEAQWSALMHGDESYAGSSSFRRLRRSVNKIMGFPYVIPVHQGRGAEQVFNKAIVKPGMAVPGNAHFDTTRAHIENCGGIPIDCTIREAYNLRSDHPFKGNVNLNKLERVLKKYSDKDESRIAYVLLTVTCNSVGGQPVSLYNIKKVSALSQRYGAKLFFDAARFAENAYFIKSREAGYKNKSTGSIALQMMKYADGVLMSAKKDAIVNMGGFIAVRDKNLYNTLSPYAILMEGFLHYGGMSGRDMEALAEGLSEGIDENYLSHRIGQVEYLADKLHKIGVPVIQPAGGHAVYVEAGKMLPHIPWQEFPGHALAVALYTEGGIRSVEIGSLIEGRDPKTHENRKSRLELLRLALPWRTYSQEHLDYVASVFEKIIKQKNRLRGVKFSYESPILRHFSSRFKLL